MGKIVIPGGAGSPFPRRQRKGNAEPGSTASTKGSETNDTGRIHARVTVPEGFFERKAGWYYKQEGSQANATWICGPLTLLAETRSLVNDNWGGIFQWKDHDGYVHTRALPKSLAAGEGAELRAILLDRGFDIATSREAKSKFSELLTGMKCDVRALAVDTPGWKEGVFVTPAETIGKPGSQLVIYQGPDSLDHPYRSRGTIEAWHTVARRAVGNSRLATFLAAAFVSPCLPLLVEESGGFHLRGASSTGKSTALFLAASVWGGEDFVMPWRATANGLEGACTRHSQTLLCLDEIGQIDPREAGFAAYMIGNGRGKARASRSGILRSTASWQVFFLSSGEISLSEHAGRDARGAKRSAAGQEVRICDIPADAGERLGLFETLHDAPDGETLARVLRDGCREAHGIAGPLFIKRIVDDLGTVIPALKASIDSFVSQHVPRDAGGQVARVARRFGMVAAVGELATKLGVLPWPENEATAACSKTFKAWLGSRGGLGSAEDLDAVAKVRGFIELHGNSRFEPIDENEPTMRVINRAGFWRDTPEGRDFLFLKEAWKTEVCAGMDASRVAKALVDQGFLRQDSGGKNSITVNLPGIGKTRCYAVKSHIFESDGPLPLSAPAHDADCTQ